MGVWPLSAKAMGFCGFSEFTSLSMIQCPLQVDSRRGLCIIS